MEKLVQIFKDYGEEKYALSIAKGIIKARDEKPIETTFELVEVIKKSLPAKELRKKGHPAKQVFQALRIAVNNELDVFSKSLADALEMLNPGGRICVITFHSLEDRICKQMFKEKTENVEVYFICYKKEEMEIRELHIMYVSFHI